MICPKCNRWHCACKAPAGPRVIRGWASNSKRGKKWAEQDGKCHLCGGLMLRETSRHPLSVTLDHLTPASMGGTAAAHNIKLAHKSCNHERGSKPLQR